jgi:nicotinic acid mononucleotide adenylyltransferase
VFPHKRWSGASFDQRLALLTDAARDLEHTSIASSDKGLFVEIAHDCREQYGREVKLSFLCGADAAERIANWDYGDPAAFGRMMEQFDLLVAERGGRFSHPHRPLPLPADYGHVSATAVRERIARGEAWEHLVPPSIRDRVRAIYRSEPATGRTR